MQYRSPYVQMFFATPALTEGAAFYQGRLSHFPTGAQYEIMPLR